MSGVAADYISGRATVLRRQNGRWHCHGGAAAPPYQFSVDEWVGTVSQGSPEGLRGNRWADGFESPWDSRVERERYGVRRQSGSGDGAFERAMTIEQSTRLVRAKAVSRRACHRSPRHAGAMFERNSWTERQPQRGDIFVESAMEMNSSSVPPSLRFGAVAP